MITVDQIERYLGQKIKDEYGRFIGTLLSIYADVSGSVESVEVALNEDNYKQVHSDRLKLTPDGVVVIQEWKVDAINVENQLDRVRKRMRAVEELYRKGNIPGHAYEEMKSRLDKEFSKIKEKVKEVKLKLRQRINDLEDQIIRLEKATSNLMVLYMSNEVSETSYKASIDYLRQSKSKAQDEKKDIEKHLDIIEKLEAEPTETKTPLTTVATAPPPQLLIMPKSEGPIQVQVVDH